MPLTITIPEVEYYDEGRNRFFLVKACVLQLEHSLLSVSKWESNWQIPFFSKEDKTPEQTIDYVRYMTLTQSVDPFVYQNLTNENLSLVEAYIRAPMTATTIKEDGPRNNTDVITNEVIYSWMALLAIPFSCEKWHLNRLLTLIKVANINNQPKKKKTQAQLAADYRAINELRRAEAAKRGQT
jgi:hypothetical protein